MLNNNNFKSLISGGIIDNENIGIGREGGRKFAQMSKTKKDIDHLYILCHNDLTLN